MFTVLRWEGLQVNKVRQRYIILDLWIQINTAFKDVYEKNNLKTQMCRRMNFYTLLAVLG